VQSERIRRAFRAHCRRGKNTEWIVHNSLTSTGLLRNRWRKSSNLICLHADFIAANREAQNVSQKAVKAIRNQPVPNARTTVIIGSIDFTFSNTGTRQKRTSSDSATRPRTPDVRRTGGGKSGPVDERNPDNLWRRSVSLLSRSNNA
jgi:hypothetical protein